MRSGLYVFFLLSCMGMLTGSCRHDEVVKGFPIALTFDDGPDGVYTPKILDILKEENAKASFFLIGKRIKHFPAITRRIYTEGHCIGNHSHNHTWLPGMQHKLMLKEISHTEFLIDSVVGYSSKYFRAPWGAIDKNQTEALTALGYTVFKWDIDSHDWDAKHTSVDEIVNQVVSLAHPGCIVLLHSADFAGIEGREKTLAALPRIIHALKDKHYRFVTLEELMRERH
jgi:peptidoglycan/xylan/chitin deacetylase (PgdA/CDA1 family)